MLKAKNCLSKGVDIYLGWGFQKSNEKKGNDDRSRKAIVYIVSDDITQASNFCRSWDPYIQSTQSERENCVGIGLLHLSEVLDCWKEMGCPF